MRTSRIRSGVETNEQQILEFMEEVEYHETYSEESGLVSVKDTETGRVEEVDVNNDIYRQ